MGSASHSGAVKRVTLGDILSFIDSKKRVVGDSLSQLGSDPAEFLAQALARLKADTPARVTPTSGTLADIFHGVANPDAVLGSPVAGAGQAFSPLGLAGVMTYHGTPHKFDRYDLSKLGTGEGAQVYGEGMYFAEQPEVASVYRKALSQTEMRDASGNVLWKAEPGPPQLAPGGIPDHIAGRALEYAHDVQSSAPYQLAAQTVREDMRNSKTWAPQHYQAALDRLAEWKQKGVAPSPSGALYKQDLPDEMLPRMLQWEKPFSEQPNAVRDALEALRATYRKSEGAEGPYISEGATGQQILGELYKTFGTSKTPAVLQGLGIPGVSYLDAGSRATSGGELLGTFQKGGKWFAKVRVDNRDLGFQNAPTTGFTTSAPHDTEAAALKWANDAINGGTMNHVVWSQPLLDRMRPQAVE